MQLGRARGLLELCSYLGPPARYREAVDERVHVKPGAAHKKGALSAGRDLGDHGLGFAHKTSHVPGLGRVGHVDHVMRYAVLLFGARLCSADVHAPVHLHRVRSHYLDVAQFEGHHDAERGFP